MFFMSKLWLFNKAIHTTCPLGGLKDDNCTYIVRYTYKVVMDKSLLFDTFYETHLT
jgi:hypothetical protein